MRRCNLAAHHVEVSQECVFLQCKELLLAAALQLDGTHAAQKEEKKEHDPVDAKLLFFLEMTECSSEQLQFRLADVKPNRSWFIF